MISVLYVEDDVSLLEIGKFLLEKDGSVEVDTCSSVSDALRKISGKRYDIIISDYAMPVTNGIKFLKSLRSAGDTTPFFFFAGKGRKSVIIDALNLGADFYLEKAGNAKVQFEELKDEIQRATERKSTSMILDQSNLMLKSVLDAVAEGVLVVDPDGKITTFNQNFLSLLKIPGDLTGIGNDSPVLLKYIQDQLEDSGDFSRKIETMSTDPGITCQGTIHVRDGQVFAWSSRARKTGDTISGRIWSFRDISEQNRTGLQLATVKEQLNAVEEELHHHREEREKKEEMIQKGEEIIGIITRATPDGILTSIDGNIVKTNEQFAEMLGYSTPELAGRSLLDFISPDSPGEVMNSIRSGSGGRYEYSALHRNGSSFRVDATGYPVSYRGDTILVSIVRRVPDTALHQEKSPGSGGIQIEPEREEAGTSPELISEPGPDGRIRPEQVSFVSVTAGITTKGNTTISHLTADAGEDQALHQKNSPESDGIQYETEREEGSTSHEFFSESRQEGEMSPVCQYLPASLPKEIPVSLLPGKSMMHTFHQTSGKPSLPRAMITVLS
jgi:PAS domain S-box-containing protein